MGADESKSPSWHTGQLPSMHFSRHLWLEKSERFMQALQFMQWKKSTPRPRPTLRWRGEVGGWR
jgi:hypothetical protein